MMTGDITRRGSASCRNAPETNMHHNELCLADGRRSAEDYPCHSERDRFSLKGGWRLGSVRVAASPVALHVAPMCARQQA